MTKYLILFFFTFFKLYFINFLSNNAIKDIHLENFEKKKIKVYFLFIALVLVSSYLEYSEYDVNIVIGTL